MLRNRSLEIRDLSDASQCTCYMISALITIFTFPRFSYLLPLFSVDYNHLSRS